jgi:hypothetical protein
LQLRVVHVHSKYVPEKKTTDLKKMSFKEVAYDNLQWLVFVLRNLLFFARMLTIIRH